MCTVSWLVQKDSYHLLFNRDEHLTRSQALAPQLFDLEGSKVIMPIDPDGNGSWIATNEFGLSVCLLNYYQGETPAAPLISRGLLLKSLSKYRCPSDVAKQLSITSLTNYAPFSLLVLGYELSEIALITMWVWDGKTLKKMTPNSPFTSSSVEFERVCGQRMALASAMGNNVKIQDLIHYHQSHQPHKGFMSVCMHRSDGKSVSFSHILVGPKRVDFNYKNGSPCADIASNDISLLRTQ